MTTDEALEIYTDLRTRLIIAKVILAGIKTLAEAIGWPHPSVGIAIAAIDKALCELRQYYVDH